MFLSRLGGIQNPPLVSLYKVNFDAAWAKDHNEVEIEVVIHDHTCDFYAGLSKNDCKVSSAEAAKLVAALEAINFAVDAGFRNILLEGDNLGVINAIREDGLDSRGAIVVDIIRASLFCNSLQFSFVKRDENSLAYSLAKFARFISDFIVWLEDPPDWLNVVLFRDIPFSHGMNCLCFFFFKK